jgi:hypothetical protein
MSRRITIRWKPRARILLHGFSVPGPAWDETDPRLRLGAPREDPHLQPLRHEPSSAAFLGGPPNNNPCAIDQPSTNLLPGIHFLPKRRER